MRNRYPWKAMGVLLMVILVSSCKSGLGDYDPTEYKIDSLLSVMTVEEKIGQLIQENGGQGHDEDIKRGRVGSVLNEVNTENINRLQQLAIDSSRLGIPIIFARDVIHGFKTIFPIPLGLAATFNPELIEKTAAIAAMEAASVGIRWTFSPMIDVCRDPRWGRIAESFGEDTHLQSLMGEAMVKGYQASALNRQGSIASCAKHFVAYGAAEGGRDYNTVSVPENELRDVYLPPFKACVDAGVATLMTAFNEVNGVPASGNRFLLDRILQQEWQYKGLVVSDWESIPQMQTHGYTTDLKESAFEAFDAGMHMEMNSKGFAEYLKELIDEGRIPSGMLDDAARKILELKFRLGLFDNPYTFPENFPALLNEDHKEVARQAAAESVVLLKNKGPVLPLGAEIHKIAIIGPLANSPHDQLGTWIFDGDKRDAITPLESITEYFGSSNIQYAPGMEISRTKTREGFNRALQAAKNADIILLFLGEESILSGESHCRADIGLPGAQEELVQTLSETGKPLVVIVMAGRPLTFEKVLPKIDALLYAWHPGTMAGPALRDILFGIECPSGKLPVTFPRHVGQVPLYYNHKNTGKPATDLTWERMDDIPAEAAQLSIGNTSHYLDYGFKPWFPFGFGLSYTHFEYSDFRVKPAEVRPGDSIVFYASLKNTGEYAGTEVVQLYIRDMVASRTRPVRELKAFQRVTLEPGEIKDITMKIHTSQLGFHNQDMDYVTEAGDFKAWIGGDSETSYELDFSIKK